MQSDPENEIIARVKAGMTNEFEILVRRYQAALFRIVGNLVDRPFVEDIVQDIFLAAFIHIQRFDPRQGQFRTWLYRIARNQALNARRKKRERLLDCDPQVTDKRTPARDLLAKEAFSRLDQVVGELDFQDRVIFVLAELEGLSYKQIADIESLALGTVKSRLSRIREKLRRALKPFME